MDMTFYDREGNPVAYSEDGINIYLYNGDPVGYIDADSIYSFSGDHLGWFNDGWILDHDGGCLFFIPNAAGEPLRPLTMLAPLKELKDLLPTKNIREIKPTIPAKSMDWSPLSLEEFFRL
jgi:hypothetical protein